MFDFFYKTSTSIKSKRLPVTSIIHYMENVLSPANVSVNNSRHAKWVALGNLAESFIYIRDWNREAMSVLLCNVIYGGKKKVGAPVRQSQGKTSNENNSLSVGVGANWNR